MSSLFPIPRQTRRQDLIASAGQTVFGVTDFKIYDAGDLRVRARSATGVFTTLARTAWTSALVGDAPNYATVTLLTGRAAGDIVRIEGAMRPQRLTNVTQAGTIRALLLEGDLDRLTVFQQEERRDSDDAVDKLDQLDSALVQVIAAAAAAAASAAVAQAAAAALSPAALQAAVSAVMTTPGMLKALLPTVEPAVSGTPWLNGDFVVIKP